VEAEERASQASALLRLAWVNKDQNKLKDSIKNISQAYEISVENNAITITAMALYMLAELDRANGDTSAALEGYIKADELSKTIGDPDLQWQIEFGRAMALEQSARTGEAIVALQTAVDLIEAVRNRLREKRYRSGYLQDKYQVYIELVRLQMKLSRSSDAFETAERLRTWSYIEQTGFSGAGVQSEEQQRTRIELRERIRQLQRNLEAEQSQEIPDRRQLAIEAFSSELMLAERQFQALLDDIAGQDSSPGSAKLQARPGDIQSQLRSDEALVEYVVGTRSVTIFVLTADSFHALNVPARQNNLHSRLELLRNLLEQRNNDRWRIPALSLADTLLQPVIDPGWLNDIKHLYLVPHGMLNYLPFALLPLKTASRQQPLIEQFTLSYLPTASSLARNIPVNQQTYTMLALAPAVSRLQHAPEEVQSIGKLYSPNAQLLIGKSATESIFKTSAGDFQILHLATHSYFNKLNPMLSGLQLEADETNDGLLEVHEILELKLDSDLVTLSACKTGLGSGYFSAIPAGDDFVGMTRAFLQVGSASVLATLWEVEDRSTVNLMNSFYGRLNEGNPGRNKASALAGAQRAFLSSQNYQHPYYWAPFVLVGSMNQTLKAQS
jgi:CHAT domain-containing protein